MNVNGNAATQTTTQSPSAAQANGTASTGFDALLGNQGSTKSNVVSGMQTTLPNGEALGMYQVSLAGNVASGDAGTGSADANGSGASSAAVSEQQQKSDQAMLAAFKQMSAYFGQTVTAENTTLEGTAALDLTL